jgi:uncharacterized membrane protein YccC
MRTALLISAILIAGAIDPDQKVSTKVAGFIVTLLCCFIAADIIELLK